MSSTASIVTPSMPLPDAPPLETPPKVSFWVRFLNLHPKPDAVSYFPTPVQKVPSVDFSLTGVVYTTMMLFMGFAAINTQANLLFGVFGLMLGVLVISVALCRLVLIRLRVERMLPDHGVVGETVGIQYQFHNAKRFWPSLSVGLMELDGAEAFTRQPNAYLFHAAATMKALVTIGVTPQRRGLYWLDNYQIATGFPFGFIKRALDRRQRDSILVYPAMARVNRRFLQLCRSAERSGAHMKPRRAGNDEFYGVKEFREGENPRLIYWKRSARTGLLVAKEMAQISPPRLMIIVDTHLPNPTLATQASVEKTIAMAASLAREAIDSGMAVGLCAWNNKWKLILPQRGKRHCKDVLAAIAELPANAAAPVRGAFAEYQNLSHGGATQVLFSPHDMQISATDLNRAEMLVVAAESSQAKVWFHFDPSLDFKRCIPLAVLTGIPTNVPGASPEASDGGTRHV